MRCPVEEAIAGGDLEYLPPEDRAMPHVNAYQIGGAHYRSLDIQPWDAMQAWLTQEEFHGFLLGNAIKYLARAGKKGNTREDLAKARHYLDKLLQLIDDE